MHTVKRLPWRGMVLVLLWSVVLIVLWELNPFYAGAGFGALAVAGWHSARHKRPRFVMADNKFTDSGKASIWIVGGGPPVFSGCRAQDSA